MNLPFEASLRRLGRWGNIARFPNGHAGVIGRPERSQSRPTKLPLVLTGPSCFQTDMSDDRQAIIARRFIEAIPHAEALGMEMVSVGKGRASMVMPYADHLIGDPETGVIHGGAVFALLDTCAGASVMIHASGPISTATLDLRVDYMRSATPGQKITATSECYHATRSVAFVRATAHDEDDMVATATGAFTVLYPKSKGAT